MSTTKAQLGGSSVSRPSKQAAAYELIRQRIERGEFAPGQRLIIDQLAEELGMSPVPIREAIRRLEAECWIDYAANTGPTVATFDAIRWAELLESIAVLEGYATALAAPFLQTTQLQELVVCNRGMKSALRDFDPQAMSVGNRRFHSIILQSCPNRSLAETLAGLQARVDHLSRMLFARDQGVMMQWLGPKAGARATADHDRLIAALRAHRSGTVIERMTREHILVHLRAVRAKLGPAP